MKYKNKAQIKDAALEAQSPYLYEHHSHHPLPRTRREFMAQTFNSFTGAVLAPSLFSLLANKSFAEELVCPAPDLSKSSLPFMLFDLKGGANMFGANIAPFDYAGNLISADGMATIGVPNAKYVGKENYVAFAGVLWHPESPMLKGIKEAFTKAGVFDTALFNDVAAKTSGVTFCGASPDDTKNPLNPVGWLVKSGLQGRFSAALGTDNSPSGGGALGPTGSFGMQPVFTGGKDTTLINLVSTEAPLGVIAGGDLALIREAGLKLSQDTLNAMQGKSFSEQQKALYACNQKAALDKYKEITASLIRIDGDSPVLNAFNISADNSDRNRLLATITKMLLDGLSGAATFAIGGCDYHGQGDAQTRTDIGIGRSFGRALLAAHLKAKPLVIHMCTDGGLSSKGASLRGDGFFDLNGDSAVRSGALMSVYNPTAKVEQFRSQIGAYGNAANNPGAIDKAEPKVMGAVSHALIADNVVNLTRCVTANYLALVGREQELEKITGANPFGAKLADYIAFKKLA